jgi:hypothetical protein
MACASLYEPSPLSAIAAVGIIKPIKVMMMVSEMNFIDTMNNKF